MSSTRVTSIAFAAAALAAVALAGGAPAAVPGIPAIYVDYGPDCTFTMSVDPGTTLSVGAPGPTLAPGTWQLLVSMPNPSVGFAPCTQPVFSLTGPGVQSVVAFPGAALNDERVITLQPSSTYVAADANAPAATRRVFTTAASGTATAPAAPGGASGGKAGTVSGDLVGSAVLRYRGRLAAKVDAAGKVTLARAGRSVRSLKAGRYDVVVDDRAARAGFFVKRGSRAPLAVTTAAFVGRKTRLVSFKAGAWTFFSHPGNATAFTVAG